MISVLIVDDSVTICNVLKKAIELHPAMQVVGIAHDAFQAKELVNRHKPDVITLDVQMPEVDGLRFLEKLMKARPTPVVMFSSLTGKNSDVSLKALELGAVDFIPKSQLDLYNTAPFTKLLHEKLLSVANTKITTKPRALPIPGREGFSYKNHDVVVAIGASTGGTEAIKQVMQNLPSNFPPVVVALHMPKGFTESYANRLDALTALAVREACDGERLLAGHAYIAPGDHHLRIVRKGVHYEASVLQDEKVTGHRPSVDALFLSVAEAAGKSSIGILLTGMGKDGASGLATIKQAGGHTLVQDEASCVVYGMPKEAAKINAHCEQVALENIPVRVMSEVKRR
ncbi:protein-glutamate methylesterase/protein-glutamine glutaminase [Alteromonas sediminis]|uniref:protein-glutamate methylesterase/protein-glutamine glutaminase n=1 Tax=Alteromonas sediminis TaxID=2259342 RepID=UPI00196A85B8|nr:chemotaxis response regulator protein-glutamate methylesterase [Alteromonas sediminis]